ncbi:MAG: BamA/TamA family outer membrane protein, partial [Saprospiraceae bacterium]|nr:BamA/TamA family outer membrane protein [Saprospiraceae bacterium]
AAPLWYVRGSINYDSDFNAGLLLNATGRNVGIRGSILSADLRVSENPGLFVDYLFYNRSSPSIGLKWHGSFNTFLGRRFDNFQLVDEFSFHHLSTRLSLVSGISRTAALEAGVFVDRLAQDRKFFTQQNEAAFAKQVGLFLKLSRDTYDRTYFPTEGSLTSIRAQWTFGGRLDERLDARESIPMDNNLVLTARLHKVFPLNENWWLSWINGAGLINYKQRSFINQLFLGREVPGEESFFEIMGLRYMEQPTTAFGSTAFRLRRRISKSSTFAGFTYNALWHASSEFQFLSKADLRGAYTSDWFHGLGLEIGALTTFGPIRLTSEYNLNIGRFNFSLFAGYRF